jgi:hypothetical protein
VKKLKYLCSAFLVASLLAIPATAQRVPMGRMGQTHHHNNGLRKDNDKAKENPDRDKAKGKAKAKGEGKGETQGKHKGRR